MTELKGKVAAVTGAASGLGRAMALAFASEGMDVALADVEEKNLLSVQKEIEAKGVRASSMRVDVSKQSEVDAFAAKTGKIHLVCNNAGVSPLGAAWENSVADWQWILGVNLWGVIHGVRAFVPHDLRSRGSAVGVSVLCPAYVPTGIADSERNRPGEFPSSVKSKETLAKEAMLKKAVASGRLSADDVARAVVAAVKQNRFYILTHPRIKGAIRARMEDILEERAPRDPLAI